MSIQRVTAIYFSPTGNAKKIAQCIAGTAAAVLNVPLKEYDFTLPSAREDIKKFSEDDLIAFCMPVYAGRIPNRILPFVQSGFEGGGAKAIIACCYGNRDFQDALMETYLTLTADGFEIIAAAALTSEHAFAPSLAAGRPDEADLNELADFTREVIERCRHPEKSGQDMRLSSSEIPGNDPVGPYYTPLGIDGKPAQFLKAKPKTDMDRCDNCGICADLCPVGSIDHENFAEVPGICIKCQACIRSCPKGAKYLDDEAFLSHKAFLETTYTDKKENLFFL